jgi:hypothetical protein
MERAQRKTAEPTQEPGQLGGASGVVGVIGRHAQGEDDPVPQKLQLGPPRGQDVGELGSRSAK